MTGCATLDEAQVAILIVDVLFQQILPDDTERWDAWMKLADLLPTSAVYPALPPPLRRAAWAERDIELISSCL